MKKKVVGGILTAMMITGSPVAEITKVKVETVQIPVQETR